MRLRITMEAKHARNAQCLKKTPLLNSLNAHPRQRITMEAKHARNAQCLKKTPQLNAHPRQLLPATPTPAIPLLIPPSYLLILHSKHQLLPPTPTPAIPLLIPPSYLLILHSKHQLRYLSADGKPSDGKPSDGKPSDGKPPYPNECLHCGEPVSKDDNVTDMCRVNYCINLPYKTLRIAADLFMRMQRYPCPICAPKEKTEKIKAWFFNPHNLEKHFKSRHVHLYKTGHRCDCGAYFPTEAELEEHQKRKDALRCPIKNESEKQRRQRLKIERKEGKQLDKKLRGYGF